jgi:hypothetical protein
MSEAKKALEVAVGKIAKSYTELLRVAEKHGDDIGKEDYTKAQYYLTETIRKIWEKVDIVRDVAKATSGEFSLDSIEIPAEPETLKMTWHPGVGNLGLRPILPSQMPAQIDPSSLDGRSLAKHIGGRLTKEAQRARPTQSVSIDLDGDEEDDGLGPSDDLLNDVDFIDDK